MVRSSGPGFESRHLHHRCAVEIDAATIVSFPEWRFMFAISSEMTEASSTRLVQDFQFERSRFPALVRPSPGPDSTLLCAIQPCRSHHQFLKPSQSRRQVPPSRPNLATHAWTPADSQPASKTSFLGSRTSKPRHLSNRVKPQFFPIH